MVYFDGVNRGSTPRFRVIEENFEEIRSRFGLKRDERLCLDV